MPDYTLLLSIAREPVESSNIASIGYSEINKAIVIEFLSDHSVYGYLDCDKELFNKLQTAESIGKFFHANIRNVKETIKLV